MNIFIPKDKKSLINKKLKEIRGIVLYFKKKTVSCDCEVITEDSSFYNLSLFRDYLESIDINCADINIEIEKRKKDFNDRYGLMFKRMMQDL